MSQENTIDAGFQQEVSGAGLWCPVNDVLLANYSSLFGFWFHLDYDKLMKRSWVYIFKSSGANKNNGFCSASRATVLIILVLDMFTWAGIPWRLLVCQKHSSDGVSIWWGLLVSSLEFDGLFSEEMSWSLMVVETATSWTSEGAEDIDKWRSILLWVRWKLSAVRRIQVQYPRFIPVLDPSMKQHDQSE